MPPWVATHPTARASQPPVLVQEPGRGRRTHLERHRIFRWCRGWHCAERRSRHRTRRPRYRHRTGQLRAGLGGQVGCAAQRRCAVWGTHQHLRARPGGRSGIIGAWCHPDRHLEGHRRGFRGRRRIFGQLRVQRRRWNSVSRLGCTDHHPIAVRILNQVGGIPRRDHALATSRLGQRRRRRSLAYVAFQRFLVLLQHPGPLPGVAQLVGPLGGIGGQPQCEP